jgi:alginate O-acetyltransferase complex protein AlgJ
MKKRIIAFLVFVLSGLCIVPAVNFLVAQRHGIHLRWKREELFNMDLVAAPVNWALSRVGISTDPAQVVVGEHGWYFLGDHYENVRTVTRHGADAIDRQKGSRLAGAMAAWECWLRSKGVRTYRVMIAPNKEAIYPEMLPGWAKPPGPTALDALMQGVGHSQSIVFDLRPSLMVAKQIDSRPLYYLTDTHWNMLSAAVAYKELARRMATVAPDVRWLDAEELESPSTATRQGGDLTRFLRIQDWVSDQEPQLSIEQHPLPTELYDFDSGNLIQRTPNRAIDAVNQPLLVHTPSALNKLRVLWLRDSFGTSMSPLIAATFSDVVQLHWIEAFKPDGRMVDLVERWKPDIVIVTVVERLSNADILEALPPIDSIDAQHAVTPVHQFDAPLARNMTRSP